MSDLTETEMPDFLRIVEGFIQRAMAYGFTRKQAERLCKELA